MYILKSAVTENCIVSQKQRAELVPKLVQHMLPSGNNNHLSGFSRCATYPDSAKAPLWHLR